jgi:protocatechuate 3,4-dioxygenase, beta subunit
MIVTGRVTDGEGRPVAGQLVEIWQANAAGRYIHTGDRHPVPIDPIYSAIVDQAARDRRWLPTITV